MIRVSHTLFALPFALSAYLIIHKKYPYTFSFRDLLLIVGAFTFLRSFAMGVNRIVDREIDARNPRTKNREIPQGKISLKEAWIFVILSWIGFEVCAFLLNKLAFFLSFPLSFLMVFYSYTKRFHWMCHFILGALIGLAPVGVYVALLERIPIEALLLFMALFGYISGLDILYSIQDVEFDKKEGLYSIPAIWGVEKALKISFFMHGITSFSLFLLYFFIPVGISYFIGYAILVFFLFKEHQIVGWEEKSLKKENIPKAFFQYNVAVSLLLFISIGVGLFIK